MEKRETTTIKITTMKIGIYITILHDADTILYIRSVQARIT